MPNPKDKSGMFLAAWKEYASPIIQANFQPVPEYPFDRLIKKRHKFDWAFPIQYLAIEIDGGNYIIRYSQKIHQNVVIGSHTQPADLMKGNIAVALGWRVMHFTPGMLRHYPKLCIDVVVNALLPQPAPGCPPLAQLAHQKVQL